jgi:hypothetical protein
MSVCGKGLAFPTEPDPRTVRPVGRRVPMEGNGDPAEMQCRYGLRERRVLIPYPPVHCSQSNRTGISPPGQAPSREMLDIDTQPG